MYWRIAAYICLWLSSFLAVSLSAGQLPDHHWELLAVAYPPDRGVSVVLGGAEKTLTSKGVVQVKWRDQSSYLEIEVKNLPPVQEIGWSGQQYVLWAIDSERRTLNLGPVPLQKKDAKWKVQIPFRIFGLLVTAEKNPKVEAPSSAVVLESLLPTDPFLVVPVVRLNVELVPAQS